MKIILIIIITLFTITNTQAEKRWVLKYVPFGTPRFAELKCLDSLDCVALVNTVNNNTVYKSTDQGGTWYQFSTIDRTKPTSDSIRSIYQCLAYDSLQLYMLFINGAVIEKSIDAGKTFTRVYFEELYKLPTKERFYDIDMYDKQLGAAVTISHLVYTRDNWDSYTLVPIADSMITIEPLFFIDSNNIAVQSIGGVFMQYNIPNDEWSLYYAGEKVPDGEDYKIFSHLSFVGQDLIFASGFQFVENGNFSTDIIWKSTDRGKTWIKLMEQLGDPPHGLRRIAFKDENHGIAVANWGKIYETTDGGESWFQQPFQDELRSIGTEIEWAGEYPIYASQSTGIFRLETVTDVEELSSNDKFRVFQSGKNLEIAINDESYATYSFSLYNSSGQSLMARDIKSSFGFVFEPVELINLTNGVYYYTISKNNGVEFNGKLVVVE